MKTKGQTALETSFVILLIVVAISHIVVKANILTYEATTMAKARAVAQGAAFELSMSGITTHLVRIDENVTSGLQVVLYAVSKDCDAAGVKFNDTINAIHPNLMSNLICSESLYSDTEFNP